MWRSKNKSDAEQGSVRGRQVDRGGGPSPAFSYYTNSRGPETVRDRGALRGDDQPKPARKRFAFAQMPFWLLLVVTGVCLVKVLWLSTTPKVIVLGNTAVSATYVQPTGVYETAAHGVLASSLTSRSKLTVDLNGAARKLEREFPELQAVSLGVPLVGSRPIVYVQLAQPSVVLQTTHGNFAVNKNGVVLASLRSVPAGVPLLVDQSNTKPQPGKQYLPSSTVGFLKTVEYQLTAAHQTVTSYQLPPDSPYELQARLNGLPYYIRFNLQADALTQSGAVVAVQQHLGGVTPATYIDVRVPGRAYYK